MIRYNFKIPLYYVDVTLIQVESEKDANSVETILKNIKTDKEYLDDTVGNIKRGCMNGGDTYRNLDLKKFVVIFYRMSSEKNRDNCYSHEKRHIEDRVLEWYSVNDIESAGLLAGFLGEKFSDFEKMQKKA